jgi:hypothetical protein
MLSSWVFCERFLARRTRYEGSPFFFFFSNIGFKFFNLGINWSISFVHFAGRIGVLGVLSY